MMTLIMNHSGSEGPLLELFDKDYNIYTAKTGFMFRHYIVLTDASLVSSAQAVLDEWV